MANYKSCVDKKKKKIMCNCSFSVFTSVSFFSVRCRRGQTLQTLVYIFVYAYKYNLHLFSTVQVTIDCFIKRCAACAPTMMFKSFFELQLLPSLRIPHARETHQVNSRARIQNHIYLVRRIYCLSTIIIQFINIRMIQIFRELLTH